MSVVGEKIWLVTITAESTDRKPGEKGTTGHRLYASAEGAAEGLRDMFDEMLGIDDLPPAVVTDSKALEELDGAFYGDFVIDGKQIDYLVVPVIVDE